MELESSSPYPQVPATCPYPEPTPFSPHDPRNFLKIHLIIILPSTSWSTQCSLSSRLSKHIYLLTPWSRVLLGKLTVNFSASQEIPRIYGTRKSLTVPTSASHLSLSWANSIQSPRPHETSWRSILLFSHLRLGLPNGFFPSGFRTNTLCTLLSSPYAPHL
jgi:hypothetical protein